MGGGGRPPAPPSPPATLMAEDQKLDHSKQNAYFINFTE